jgi:predicted nucleotidyltransferase
MKSELIEKISLYFDRRSEVTAVYLFGSYAKGRQEMDSDIDLAILLNRDYRPRQNELRRQYIVDLSHILRKDLHILMISSIDEGIFAQIFRYGQCIVNHNPHLLARFKMIAYAMIAEFGYHKNLMKKGFIRKLTREIL